MPSRFNLRNRGRTVYARVAGADFVRQGSWLFLSTLLGSAALYIFHFFATRRLGPDSYGILASMMAAIAFIAYFAQLGTTIVARFAAEFQACEDAGKLRRLLNLVLQSCLLVVAAGGIVAVVLRRPLAGFLHADVSGLVELTVMLTVSTVVLALLRGLLQGIQRFKALSISQFIEYAGRAALGIGGIVLGFGIRGALIGQVVGSLVALAYTFFDVNANLSATATRLRIDLRRLFITTRGIASAFLALAILINFDIILAKHYLNAHEAGLYAAATLAGRTMATVMYFVPTLLLPKATARAASGSDGHELLLSAFGVAAAFSLAALAAFYFFSNFIVLIIAGNAYSAAAPLVFLYGCAATVFGFVSIAVSYKTGHNQFNFAGPLLAIVACEVLAIAFFHTSAAQIIYVLIAANVVALVPSLYRIRTPAATS